MRAGQVPADATRERIALWQSQGYSVTTVASAAGLPHSVVGEVLRGERINVEAATERAVLAVTRRMLDRDAMLVPSGPVRAHVQALLKVDGVTVQRVADAAGKQRASVDRVLQGRTAVTWRPLADALLAVSAEDAVAVSRRRPAAVAVLRCRQLQARGWPLGWQARALGTTGAQPTFLTRSRRWVSVDVDDRMRALWEEYRYRLGPSERTAAKARRAGFYPAEVYDGEGNLRQGLLSRLAADPAAYPASAYDDDGVLHLEWVRGDDALEAQRERRVQVAERRREVHRLTAEGLTVAEIAQRLECTTDVVHADRRREAPAVPVVERLPDTPAEREAVILALLEQGCTPTAVAKALKVSPRTVQRYVRAVS